MKEHINNLSLTMVRNIITKSISEIELIKNKGIFGQKLPDGSLMHFHAIFRTDYFNKFQFFYVSVGVIIRFSIFYDRVVLSNDTEFILFENPIMSETLYEDYSSKFDNCYLTYSDYINLYKFKHDIINHYGRSND